MIRNILLGIIVCLSFHGFSQNTGLKRHKTDTTLIYRKDIKLYEFVLENKNQGLYWDTLKTGEFALPKFKIRNNTKEIIILKNVRQDDGTITFFSDSPDKIIYPDSSIRIKMIYSKRLGPFTSYVRITYLKGKEEKQSTIPTWGYYGTPYTEVPSHKLPVPEEKPAFVPPPIQTIVHEQKVKKPAKEKEKEKKTTEQDTVVVGIPKVSAKRDYFITLISGTENITSDSYLIIHGEKIRSTLHDKIGTCFKLRAKPSEAWPVKIVTKKHGVYNTTVFFNRANFCIRVPNPGEKYRYSGSFIMLNPIHKGYYFIKAPTADDYRAIETILEKKHLQRVFDIHLKAASDQIILPSDSAAAVFEKELRSKGIKATLEPGTEWRDDMWEMDNGKAVQVAKAYVLFNLGTSDQWIAAMLKRFGNVTYTGSRLSGEQKEEYGNCPEYHITVHTNLYKEYMAVFDKLWNMKEVKHLEQLRNATAEAD